VALWLALGGCLVALVVGACGGSSSKPIPLFVFAGQSNMLGTGARVAQLSPDIAKADPRVQYWNDLDRAWTTAIPSDANGSVGPDVSALHQLASRLGGTVAAVKVAANGSSLVHDWDPGRSDGLYVSLRNAVSDAQLKAVPGHGTPKIAGFFWMQGETDGIDPNTSAIYDANLRKFIEQMRTDLGDDRLPFVLGRVRFSESNSLVVRLAQEDVGKNLPKVETVDTDDLKLVDNLHYDTPSIEALGRRMADAYLALR